jgi:hypothetical protein
VVVVGGGTVVVVDSVVPGVTGAPVDDIVVESGTVVVGVVPVVGVAPVSGATAVDDSGVVVGALDGVVVPV